ncbi:hypothetical protein GCM10011611_26950 [Aliidongia dinghuensis]|uniref:TadE-like protein n=1 Tax=Aliidongia dinghuensis TaxID=1867774 RepID=A0A8J2YTH6_9PROT|nr:TadE/TadG family type IV pilus assembly protein [Aliidongia dinghuensis]GGF19611.1 hypothetical protein GCM10011611_26950 [Aliidongia dinghuensis]
MSRALKSLARDKRGTVTAEFAAVAALFFSIVFFVIGLSVLGWARSALELSAFQTARCVAIGSTDCTSPSQYASTILQSWGASSLLPPVQVSVQSASSCGATSGGYVQVTVASSASGLWNVSPFLSSIVLSASACYPSSA